MPTRIGVALRQAVVDRTVTQQEVESALTIARAERKWTPEMKAEASEVLRVHGAAFEPQAKQALTAFLASTPTTRDLADPAALKTDQKLVQWKPVQGGQLFVDGVNYDDVVQGIIGNCYMVSAFSAVAHDHPDAIRDAIKDNGDGTYTVRFYEKGLFGNVKPVFLTVDGDTAHMDTERFHGTYGKARDSREMWVSVLEKAYAQWKGGYEAIGNGGSPSDVMQALTGKKSRFLRTPGRSADALYNEIARSVGHPMTASSHNDQAHIPERIRIGGHHSYTVLGVEQRDGQKYIRLRNPFGHTEPVDDGKNDGIFLIKAEDFPLAFQSLHIGG